MVDYKLDFSDEGKISFSSLDKAVAQRILNKLKWLTKKIEAISPLPPLTSRGGETLVLGAVFPPLEVRGG